MSLSSAVFLSAMLAVTSDAAAIGVRSPVPVAVRARLDVRLVADDAAGEWNVTSRAPADPSRFMADLTAGDARTGTLYLKGVSSWQDADDALGRVEFRLDQGEYFRAFAPGDSAVVGLRLFGDERCFFTGEAGTPVVEDDEVARFEHRLAARVDGTAGAVRAGYWAASLDDGAGTRVNQVLLARMGTRHVLAGVAYVHDNPDGGDDHAILKGELAGYVRRATAIVSYEQSGFGSGMFVPSGTWEDFDAGEYTRAAPDNSATFAELRARRARIGEDHLVDAAYRYGSVGDEYTNDLSALVPGSVVNAAWINWAHRRYALDTRLSGRHETRAGDGAVVRGADITARARFRNNAETLLRAGLRSREAAFAPQREDGFVHAAFTREIPVFLGSAHLLVDGLGEDVKVRAGAEARINWNASSAVFLRWMVADDVSGSDAVYVRFEFRPTRRAWVTVSWGRENRGDDVYFLEDRDLLPAPGAGNVMALTVRGDL
jgi:hypothetical protein